jgi:hypothetical protein
MNEAHSHKSRRFPVLKACGVSLLVSALLPFVYLATVALLLSAYVHEYPLPSRAFLKRYAVPSNRLVQLPVVGAICSNYFEICVKLTGAAQEGPNRRYGQSTANGSPVPDGRIVLLKRNKEVAAFVLKNQRLSPQEWTDFDWYYRSDGKGTFPVGDPAVSSGVETNATQVAFKTFAVPWSLNTDRKGWIYFSTGPAGFGRAAEFLMCVTTETNLAAIDANASSWHYRARPGANVRALTQSQIKK